MSSSHSKYKYFSVCDYSSHGDSEAAQQSRSLKGQIKSGKKHTIERLFSHVIEIDLDKFHDFFNKDVTLIPVPRSHKQVKGAMWPAKVVSDVIYEAGQAKEILPVLERSTKVNTSSISSPSNRPSVKEHLESLKLNTGVFFPSNVTLVDDVVTQGRTLVACALKILEKYPETKLQCFAVLKTRNFVEDIPELIAPTFNIIEYYSSGKTFRHPSDTKT